VVEASGGDHYLALGGPLHPVMIWNAEVGVILETMLMPMRVE